MYKSQFQSDTMYIIDYYSLCKYEYRQLSEARIEVLTNYPKLRIILATGLNCIESYIYSNDRVGWEVCHHFLDCFVI